MSGVTVNDKRCYPFNFSKPMKPSFTLKGFRYFALTFVLAFLSLAMIGQITHNVAVTSNVFTPSQLTITAGDKVVWKNDGGSHNVNGTQATFPNNPASFGNNVGTGWTYEFVFTVAGTYNYQCDPHVGMGMIGKVVVNPKIATTSEEFAGGSDHIRLFPNPASQYIELRIPNTYTSIRSLKVYSVTGTILEEKNISGNAESLRYDVSRYKKGMYFMEVNSGVRKDVLKFLKQ